jgi:hypothetical protein
MGVLFMAFTSMLPDSIRPLLANPLIPKYFVLDQVSIRSMTCTSP